MTNRIIYNAIRTPDGTVISSNHRHDYVCHTDTKTGETYCVDGGLEYLRRVGWHLDCKELSLSDDEPHAVQREVLIWGTYGKDGTDPYRRIKVQEMQTGHIEIVLAEYGDRLSPVLKNCMLEELKFRGTRTDNGDQ